MSNGLVFSLIVLLLFFIFQTCIIFIIFFKFISNSNNRKKSVEYFKRNVLNKECYLISSKRIYRHVSLNKYILFNVDNNDINIFKDSLFYRFLLFEQAYNNLDYEMMKACSTDRLFDRYYSSIILNLSIGNKKIITDIEKREMIIYDLRSTRYDQTVFAMIKIRYVNYTVNKLGNIISGTRKPVTEKFQVIFKKDFNDFKTNCPNCGAPIIDSKCDFCKTDFTTSRGDFVVDSIKRIVE